MNGKLIFTAIGGLVAGASAGVLATKEYFKRKYKKHADDEISQMRTAYLDIMKNNELPTVEEDKEEEPVETVEPHQPAKEIKKPKKMADILPEVVKEYEGEDEDGPVVIDPASFAVYEDYDIFELTYYPEDRVLTDELDCRLDPDRVVGAKNLEPFHRKNASGFAPDVIYIRDDGKACYYEIDRCDEPYDGPEKEE